MAARATTEQFAAAAEIVRRRTREPDDPTESRQKLVDTRGLFAELSAARSPLAAWVDAPNDLPGLDAVIAATTATVGRRGVGAPWTLPLLRWALELIGVQSRRAPRDAAALGVLARYAARFSNADALHTLVHLRAALGAQAGPPLFATAEQLSEALRLADGATALELVTYVPRLPGSAAALEFTASLARALTRNWPEKEAAFRYVSAQRPGAAFDSMRERLDARLPHNRYTLAAEALEAMLVELVLVPSFVATVISTRLDVTGSAALNAAVAFRATAGAPLAPDDTDVARGVAEDDADGDTEEEDPRVLAGDSVRVILGAARVDAAARAAFPSVLAVNAGAARALALASGDVRVLTLLHAAGDARTGAAVLVASAPEANARAALPLLEDVHADDEAALHAAVRRNSFVLVEELLLYYNAYVNAREDEALLLAVRGRAPLAVFYALGAGGANVRARDFAALREAAAAVRPGDADAVERLSVLLTLLAPGAVLVLTRRDVDFVIALLGLVTSTRARSSLFAAIEQVARERGADVDVGGSPGERVAERLRDALRQSLAGPRV